MAERLNGTRTHLFMKAFLFGYIYHITFHDVLAVCHVVYLKYILGFWHIWSWVRCGAWLLIRISLTLSLVVVRNPRLGFAFKLNNTRILQAVLVRAQLYLAATWAAEALNKVSNTCPTFTSRIGNLFKKRKSDFFWNLTGMQASPSPKKGHRFGIISGY